MQNGSPLSVGVFAAEAHEIFMRDAELITQRPKVLFDEIGAEAVVTGRDGRVRGKDNFARDGTGRGVEVEAFFDDPAANRFKDGETAVSPH